MFQIVGFAALLAVATASVVHPVGHVYGTHLLPYGVQKQGYIYDKPQQGLNQGYIYDKPQKEKVQGYIYDKPQQEKVQGYIYDKPHENKVQGYIYDKPQKTKIQGYIYDKPQETKIQGYIYDKPQGNQIQGYVYDKPQKIVDLGYLPKSYLGGHLVSESPLSKTQQGYNFGYAVSDGQKREEHAEIIPAQGYYGNAKPADNILRVKGSYNYVDPVTGKVSIVYYEADENGYRATGDIIPK